MDIKNEDLIFLKIITNYCKTNINPKKTDLLNLLQISETRLNRLLFLIKDDSIKVKEIFQDKKSILDMDNKLEQKYKEKLSKLNSSEVNHILEYAKTENEALNETIDTIRTVLNYDRAKYSLKCFQIQDKLNNNLKLISANELKKVNYFFNENIISIINENLKKTVFDIEYMKIPKEIPEFKIVDYNTKFKLENEGNHFLDIKKLNDEKEKFVIDCTDTNITYEIKKGYTAYAHSGTRVIANKGSRILAYSGSVVIARKDSLVFANKKSTIYAFVGAKLFEYNNSKKISPMFPKRVLTQTKIFNCVFIRPFIYRGGKYAYIYTGKYNFPSKINLECIIRLKKTNQKITDFINTKNNIKVFNTIIYKAKKRDKYFSWNQFNALIKYWSKNQITWPNGIIKKTEIIFDKEWYNRYFINQFTDIISKKNISKFNKGTLEYLLRLFNSNKFEIKGNSIILNNFYYSEVYQFYSLFTNHVKLKNPIDYFNAIDEVCQNSLTDPFGLVQTNQFTATIGISPKLAPYILNREWPLDRIEVQLIDNIPRLFRYGHNSKCIIIKIITSGEFELIRWLRALGKDAILIDSDNKELLLKLKESTKELSNTYNKESFQDWKNKYNK